jgi:Tetratricopeptide repeat
VKVGITLLLLHRFEEALWSFREALSIRKNALGPMHPSTARVYNNVGCVHVELGEHREARQAFESALDIQRNALLHDPQNGPLMFGTATTLCNLGYLYRFRDMFAKAALVLREAADLQEDVLGPSHATVLSTLDNLADSCAHCGQAVDSLKYYNMVLERFRAGDRGASDKAIRAEGVLLYKISRVHRQRNDRNTQLDYLKMALKAVREYSETSGEERVDTLERRIQLDIKACREEMETKQLKWV